MQYDLRLQVSGLEVALAEEKEEAADVRDFLTRELQEKEEECISLKEEYEVQFFYLSS